MIIIFSDDSISILNDIKCSSTTVSVRSKSRAEWLNQIGFLSLFGTLRGASVVNILEVEVLEESLQDSEDDLLWMRVEIHVNDQCIWKELLAYDFATTSV